MLSVLARALVAVIFVLSAAAGTPRQARATRGTATLRQAFDKLHAARSYSADLVRVVEVAGRAGPPFRGQLACMKPNYIRFELSGSDSSTIVDCDGLYMRTYSRGQPFAVKDAAPAHPMRLPGPWQGEVNAFFGGSALLDGSPAANAGLQIVGRVECDRVVTQAARPHATVTYLVGRNDHLIHRVVTEPDRGEMAGPMVITTTLTHIRLNAPMSPASFVFVPPAVRVPGGPKRACRSLRTPLTPSPSPRPLATHRLRNIVPSGDLSVTPARWGEGNRSRTARADALLPSERVQQSPEPNSGPVPSVRLASSRGEGRVLGAPLVRAARGMRGGSW